MNNDENLNAAAEAESMPLLAIRGIAVFPEMIMNFDVERPLSVGSLNVSIAGGRKIFLVAQRDAAKERPDQDDLYEIGTVCVIRQFIRNKEGALRVMVEGQYRARLLGFAEQPDHIGAKVERLDSYNSVKSAVRIEAQMRNLIAMFDEYTSMAGNSAPETLVKLTVKNDPGYAADYVAQNIFLKPNDRQHVLETLDVSKRLRMVSLLLAHEIHVQGIETEINEKLHDQLLKMQKENVLREQLRIIQNELGDDSASEMEELRQQIYEAALSEEVENKLLKEADRLARQPFGSAEASVIRSYLDICLELPWHKSTKERTNVELARKMLDKDHFGLKDVKERILEFLAVKQLAPDNKGTILCLVGPPGIGKTSIAMSIAKATNRKLARMSLGGIHDEAEIRGHRKTYVGAMPGRIISAISASGSNNPLLVLDEIDKLGSDYRGDPASALLEALDPEQNVTFRDNFLEIPFDLSNVFFITTANATDTIPRPLLDRMEVIEIGSYTDEEKLQIAKQHLLPKQRKKHGLSGATLKIGDGALRDVIAGYTSESGVRQLERELARICRKTAALLAEGKAKSVTVASADLEKLLGVRKYHVDQSHLKDEVGVVNGLAWTTTGGELLEVEASALEGTGKTELTGNLGDVMKESAYTAVSYLRSRWEKYGLDKTFYKDRDIHIHFPEGAVPKDGPSAGAAIATAVVSALTGAPVKHDIAMTGEITLRGRILAIGGLREKTMAALRNGVHTVIIPEDNVRDLEEIDQTVRGALTFIPVKTADEVIDAAVDFSRRTVPAESRKEQESEPVFPAGESHVISALRQ